MTEVLRPSLYGAQHPIVVLKEGEETQNYVVVGHCCESGDLFSCAPGDPEALQERLLKKVTATSSLFFFFFFSSPFGFLFQLADVKHETSVN